MTIKVSNAMSFFLTIPWVVFCFFILSFNDRAIQYLADYIISKMFVILLSIPCREKGEPIVF